ncbi:MAG TPA: beta-ketoacyl-ACP synthase II [Candidatus Kapabacteria bacterium]|jgi:3-oxoacyl-[acyl-carrier-protein] synthase II|nr:beta-ketoacyl-ACP synthase II [Candidatus Kapabacteria bacterium]
MDQTSRRRRVVVTGMGAITPVGNTLEEYWQGLTSGRSGAAAISRFDATGFDTTFACEVKNFDAVAALGRKQANRTDLFAQFALVATDEAMNDAGLNADTIDPERTGVVYGSGIGGMWTYHHQQRELFETNNPKRISPFFIPMLIADIAAGHISMKYNLKGPNYATTSACATSSHAIADAFMLIQRGDADAMVTGGSEAVVTPMAIAGFNAMKALSTRNDSPETASCPFDVRRDGFVMGEGAGALVLETLERAQARGAKIYGEIVGVGMTADAYHLTAPAPGGEGACRSMRQAIRDAGLEITDVDYINVHGTSTPLGDLAEVQAIKSLFGEHSKSLLISATKSMTGHLLGAAGAIEAIATLMTISRGMVHPTINNVTPDPEVDVDFVPNVARAADVTVALSNTFGFGGHNATVCFRKFEE